MELRYPPEAVQNRPDARPTEEARADSTGTYGKRAPAGRTTQMGGYQRPRIAVTNDTVLRIGSNSEFFSSMEASEPSLSFS
jgi:hypothetical protein